jgi:hypothetical protein
MSMQIIKKVRWLRIVKVDNAYTVQVRHFFRWHTVTFGPYGPYPVGLSLFNFFHVVNQEFEKCLQHSKSYTLRGI